MQSSQLIGSLSSLNIPLPPADIRYRIVSQSISEDDFLSTGRMCTEDLLRTLDASDLLLRKFGKVLDFGCGCSRILRYLIPFAKETEFYGCDIDAVGIDWSQKNVPAQFSLIPHLPPTNYSADFFDFVYSLSVFSHLDLPRQIVWLKELHRILKPGGHALITIHGRVAHAVIASSLSETECKNFGEIGFIFLNNINDKILPEWYQTAIYKEDFARLVFSNGFSVLQYREKGMTAYQDIVLIRKHDFILE